MSKLRKYFLKQNNTMMFRRLYIKWRDKRGKHNEVLSQEEYFLEASKRLYARLLRRLKECTNTEGEGEDFVLYDDDITTQKRIFRYPCIPFISIRSSLITNNPKEKFLNIGIELHDYDFRRSGSLFINWTIEQIIAELEEHNYTYFFAHEFQDDYEHLEDRF